MAEYWLNTQYASSPEDPSAWYTDENLSFFYSDTPHTNGDTLFFVGGAGTIQSFPFRNTDYSFIGNIGSNVTMLETKPYHLINFNSGTLSLNNGSVYNNHGVITLNSGNVKIMGSVGGGTGSIIANGPTNLLNHTTGTNIILPDVINWW